MIDRSPQWIGSDVRIALRLGADPEVPCVLLRIGSGQIHIRANRETWPGWAAVIRFDHLSLTGEVLYCKARGEEYLICVSVSPEADQQRREPRFPMNLPAKVIVSRDSGMQALPGTVTDISKSGLGLRLFVALEIATIVYVETEKMLIVGEIRYCTKTEDEQYSVGLEASDVFSDPGASPFTGTAIEKVNRLLSKVIRHGSSAG